MDTVSKVRSLKRKVAVVQEYFANILLKDQVAQESCTYDQYAEEEECFVIEEDSITAREEDHSQQEVVHQSGADERTRTSSSLRHSNKPLSRQKVLSVQCVVCRGTFVNPSELVVHQRAQHKAEVQKSSKLVSCLFCDGAFKSKVECLAHQRRDHEEETRDLAPEETFICEVCGKEFIKVASLNMHRRTHEERLPDECPVCGQTTMDLKDHIKRHHKLGRRACPACGAEVLDLRSHMRMHQERQCKCEVCGKAFKTAADLKRHASVHTGERVKCLFCDHQATHKENSRMHMRKKHPREYEERIRRRQRGIVTTKE